MAEKEYQRLTFPHARSAARLSSLWLGKDHLLSVDTGAFSENYKRFYFRDIQAVSVCRTARGKIWNYVLAWPIICLAFLAILVGDVVWSSILSGVAGLFVVMLVINILSGPTCVCEVRTAVQVEQLASLGRLRRARKVFDRVRPLIAEAQGQLNPAEIPVRMREFIEASAKAAAAGPKNYVVDDPNAPPRLIQ